MQRIEGQLLLSPTDLTKHLACAHVTTLDLLALDGGGRGSLGATAPDDALQLVFRKGTEHESAYLQRLRAAGLSVVEIPTRFDLEGRRQAEAETLAAMREGVDVVYQATFFDGRWGGQADFLLRTDRPSDLGGWSYDIADTKLARRLKVPALLQMATYAERLAVLQGVPPQRLTVVTGDGVERPWRLDDVASYARRARARLQQAVETRADTDPAPVPHCSQCRWSAHCTTGWERADDLSLVAGMRSGHRHALIAAGLPTVEALAAAAVTELPRTIGRPSRERLAQQARLQVSERTTGQPAYELLPPEPDRGLLRLPPPSEGDVYLDFEGDPFAADGQGREYLAGLWDRSGRFSTWWAHDHDQEAALTRDLLDELTRRLAADPGAHVYHYAAYEQTALKRLTGRHGTRETELDALLRGERFVDLFAVVRQGLRISKPSYSIKKLEDFYWGHTRTAADAGVADAMSSVVEYERFLVDGDASVLESIAAYNRDDVRSTHDLHAWLEERRLELEKEHGPQPRPDARDGSASEAQSDAEVAEAELADRLREAGHPLLAGVVGWHRREERPKWWDIYRLKDLDDEALQDDPAALGGLSAPVDDGDVKQSKRWRYEFPVQDTKVSEGRRKPLDVDTQAELGEILEMDAAAGCLVMKVGRNRPAPTPRGLGPPKPPAVKVLQESIAHVGAQVLAGGAPLGRALLDRRVPGTLQARPGEQPVDQVIRAGLALDGEVLAIQGPPGSGKTTKGAAMIRALLDHGLRVGVTAQSHAVVSHLLEGVGRPALQKCDAEDFRTVPGVVRAATNEQVVTALGTRAATLVGGSAWLWARADLRGAVDVLVVDEAGQFSLANAVAVSGAARSMVLLGDPQQLTQPTQAIHPDGAGVSALEHLLDGHDTIPPDRGIFLDESFRMHPGITAFVSSVSYDGRLASAAGRERQAVSAPGALAGSGLRWVPTVHADNTSSSPQEAAVVARLVTDLLRGSWVDAEGVEHPLGLDDVLVVAPYNKHVACLRDALPEGARIGTVDKFQGQQAPVVIYSMASSSAADAPRGVDFLYDLHRLNVAVSRAKALSVVVASPALLDAEVHDPEQLRQVNALCRFVELAAPRGD